MKEAFYEKTNSVCKRLYSGEVIFSEKTDFQQIDIISENGEKALMLDAVIQLNTGDEFIYHEMAVHLPLLYHPNPKRVLVLGGGDGFIVRELLKYKSIEEIVLVDIDAKVVETCKKHFQNETENSMNDPRVNVVIQDALKYAQEDHGKFDVLIMDLVDPYDDGEALYSKEMMTMLSRMLSEDGIIATHAEGCTEPNFTSLKLLASLEGFMPYSKIGAAYVKSFDDLWGFLVFSKKELVPGNPETAGLKLRYFEPEKEKSYTKLPPFLQAKLDDYRKAGVAKLNADSKSRKLGLNEEIKDLID